MGLEEAKEMEYGRLYEICLFEKVNHWYVVKYKEGLFQGNIIFVYGFDKDNDIFHVTYGKLYRDAKGYENTDFLINGWDLNKDTCTEENYSQIGNAKTSKVYRFAKLGMQRIDEEKEAKLNAEIGRFWSNPISYFNVEKEVDNEEYFRENRTVDGFDPIDWEDVIKKNRAISGRRRHS